MCNHDKMSKRRWGQSALFTNGCRAEVSVVEETFVESRNLPDRNYQRMPWKIHAFLLPSPMTFEKIEHT